MSVCWSAAAISMAAAVNPSQWWIAALGGTLSAILCATSIWMAHTELTVGHSQVWRKGSEARATVLDVHVEEDANGTAVCVIRYHFELGGVAFLHQYRSWRHDANNLRRGDSLDILWTETPRGVRSLPS